MKNVMVVLVFGALLCLAGTAMGQNLVQNPTFGTTSPSVLTLSPWYVPNYLGFSGSNVNNGAGLAAYSATYVSNSTYNYFALKSIFSGNKGPGATLAQDLPAVANQLYTVSFNLKTNPAVMYDQSEYEAFQVTFGNQQVQPPIEWNDLTGSATIVKTFTYTTLADNSSTNTPNTTTLEFIGTAYNGRFGAVSQVSVTPVPNLSTYVQPAFISEFPAQPVAGTISPASGTAYTNGTQIPISATALTDSAGHGYQFSNWVCSDSTATILPSTTASAATLTCGSQGHATLIANFTPIGAVNMGGAHASFTASTGFNTLFFLTPSGAITCLAAGQAPQTKYPDPTGVFDLDNAQSEYAQAINNALYPYTAT